MVEKLLLPFADAQDVIGVGRSKLYEVIDEYRLPVIKLGRKSLLAMDDLRDLVARLKSEAA